MYSFLIFLFILVSALMVVAILMQASKGGGLAASFGGMGGGGGVFGPRGASNFLQKATTILATVYLLTCLLIGLIGRTSTAQRQSIIQQQMEKQQQQQQESPATNVPVAPLPGNQTLPGSGQNPQ